MTKRRIRPSAPQSRRFTESSRGTSTGRAVGSGERVGVGDASATVGAAVAGADVCGEGAAVVGAGLVGDGLGTGDGLGVAGAGEGEAAAVGVAAAVGDGDVVAPPSDAQARGSTPGGAAHTDRVGCTHAVPSDAVRDSDTRTKGWRAVAGAPQVPLSHTRSSVTVSPSTLAVLPLRRHRPPTSSPRA